jgi:THO complex subunit 4
VTKPAPENIDRYVPGQGGRGTGRSSSLRGAPGRRPGERRERPRRDDNGHALVGGRPRKTAEELDAEMEDYWGGNAAAGNGTNAEDAPAAVGGVGVLEDDIDMIE